MQWFAPTTCRSSPPWASKWLPTCGGLASDFWSQRAVPERHNLGWVAWLPAGQGGLEPCRSAHGFHWVGAGPRMQSSVQLLMGQEELAWSYAEQHMTSPWSAGLSMASHRVGQGGLEQCGVAHSLSLGRARWLRAMWSRYSRFPQVRAGLERTRSSAKWHMASHGGGVSCTGEALLSAVGGKHTHAGMQGVFYDGGLLLLLFPPQQWHLISPVGPDLPPCSLCPGFPLPRL